MLRSVNLAIHLAMLALFLMFSNCFTVDMYSGQNHMHYETSKSNDSIKPGTLISFNYPDTSYNMSNSNATSLEKALDFIASAYNNHTQSENKTQIVLDKDLDTTNKRYETTTTKNPKYIYNHGTYPYPEKKKVQIPKKLLTFEELSSIFDSVNKGSEQKERKKNFISKGWMSDLKEKRVERPKLKNLLDEFLKAEKGRKRTKSDKPFFFNNRKTLNIPSLFGKNKVKTYDRAENN